VDCGWTGTKMGNQYFIACGKRTRFYRITLLGRGIRFADELNAGDVPINGAERSAPDRRFGGMGISEIGRRSQRGHRGVLAD
jgi:hypothetical protein